MKNTRTLRIYQSKGNIHFLPKGVEKGSKRFLDPAIRL